MAIAFSWRLSRADSDRPVDHATKVRSRCFQTTAGRVSARTTEKETTMLTIHDRRRTAAPAITLSQFLADYYIPGKIQLKPTTIRQIEVTLSLWWQQIDHEPTTDDLTTARIRAFLSWMATHSKPATVNSKRAILLALWASAHDEKLAPAPEPKRIRRLPADPIPAQAWTIEQVQQILGTCEELQWPKIDGIPSRHWFSSFCWTLYSTGERRSAVLAAPAAAVDLDNGTIIFRRTKTKARICPLLPQAVEAMRRLPADRKMLFPWPFSQEYLTQRLKAIYTLANVPHGRQFGGVCHKWRRTACTLTEANGGDGSAIIGDTRAVAQKSYLDRSMLTANISKLPTPQF